MNDAANTNRVTVCEVERIPLHAKPEGWQSWSEIIKDQESPLGLVFLSVPEHLRKSVDPEDKEQQASDQGVNLGVKMQPFNMQAAINFKNQNPHHSTCIEAKTRALVGLGFQENEDLISDELDPLCDSTFHEVMQAIGEDYWQVGNGYMEVVWDDSASKIVGLHHVPAATVQICIEDVSYRRHFVVGAFSSEGTGPIVMPPFGELKSFKERFGLTSTSREGRDPEAADGGVPDNLPSVGDGGRVGYVSQGFGRPSTRAEIIHFSRRTSMNRWYGYPDWLSAVASIELVQCMTQERYDFFLNRGVPDFMLFVTGADVPKDEWESIKQAMLATLGQGNQHKTVAVNINDPNVKILVEKLAMEGSGSEAAFTAMSETLSLDIITAHRTPATIAGVQIPGKMGAVNELPNALLAFQVLVIGPEQVTFESVLGNTLGNKSKNGGLATRKKHFKFKQITTEIPLGMVGQTGGQGAGTPGKQPEGTGAGLKELDTMGRMRTPAAATGGRDLSAGVKT